MKVHIKKVRLLFRKVVERVKNILVDTKKPCRQTTNQGQGYSVSQGHTTNASISLNVSQNQLYDAEDVAEGFALAYEQVSDLAAMLTAIKGEYENIAQYLQSVHNIPGSVSADLKRLIRIADDLTDQSLEFSREQENLYKS